MTDDDDSLQNDGSAKLLQQESPDGPRKRTIRTATTQEYGINDEKGLPETESDLEK